MFDTIEMVLRIVNGNSFQLTKNNIHFFNEFLRLIISVLLHSERKRN